MATDERQAGELEALQGIYGDDFQRAASKTAWAAANAVQEFIIRIRPLDESLQEAVGLSLRFKWPAAYPRVPPTVDCEKPVGIMPETVSLVSAKLKEMSRSKELLNNEMCFELCSHAAQLITERHAVIYGQSLRQEAEKKEEQDRILLDQHRREQQALELQERQKEQARLEEMLQDDRQRRVRVLEPPPSAKKASSPRTTNNGRQLDVNTIVLQEGFKLPDGKLATLVTEGVVLEDNQFLSIHAGEAYSEDMSSRQPVAVTIVELPRSYLTSASSKKKMTAILSDLERVAAVQSPHLQQIYAYQLDAREHELRLEIVTEPHCQTTLEVLLGATGALSEERALGYMRQVVEALAELHAANVQHCDLMSNMVQLCGKKASQVKIVGACWAQHLVDMNRSEPFAPDWLQERYPESWWAPETVSEILSYTKARDMWDVGRLFLDMLLGGDVMQRYESCYAALQSEDFAELSDEVADILEALLEPNVKKRATVSKLLLMLTKATTKLGPISPSLNTVRQTSLPTPVPAVNVSVPSPSRAAPGTGTEGRSSYFWQPRQQALSQVSRYRTDFEEVEFLGKGGFGQVVKARNRLDGAYYAVKKIKLPTSVEAEQKLLREVTIWSRMTHPHIVRYNTSWVEEEKDLGIESQDAHHSLQASTTLSTRSSSSSHITGMINTDEDFDMGLDDLDFEDVDFLSVSRSASYIRFANDGDPSNAPTPDESISDLRQSNGLAKSPSPLPTSTKRTLYIQMEYVGGGPTGLTLRDAIDAGIPESDTWRLVRQILSAMQHFTSINIIHRDLKPSNIFLDSHGDVRIGDFGLAVEQAASSEAEAGETPDRGDEVADLTSDVGTGLYVAPETASRGAGSRVNGQQQPYTNKIDMYALGITLFEMWHPMSTGMERIQALRELRTPAIKLPATWKGSRRQTDILKWLLTHEPDRRAAPSDLLESELLPSTGRNEAVESVVRLLGTPRSPHRSTVISALLKQTRDERIIRDLTYDPPASETEQSAELQPYINVVAEKLRQIFERRGAYHLPCDSIAPLSEVFEDAGRKPYKLLDVDSNVLMLPYDLTVPLARKVAREPNLGRLKRWTVEPCYRPRSAGGPPEAIMAASFDIVSSYDTLAAEAETLQVLDEIASAFPLSTEYVFIVNHASLFEYALEQVPSTARANVARILETFSKKPLVPWHKMANELYKQRDLTRRVVDSLAAFHTFEDAGGAITRLSALETSSPLLHDALADLSKLVSYCAKFGMTRPIKIWPLFLANRTHFMRGGIGFQLSSPHKLGDVLALGGRYDRLLARFAPLSGSAPLPHMIGAAIAVTKLAQAAAQDSLVASQRAVPEYSSFAPRRCDVYVMSYGAGLLEARMQVVAQLWSNGISADLMYDERDWSGQSPEQAAATWRKEGILFVVIVKHAASGDQIVRVRSVLRGGEEDISRLELPAYLSERIADQIHASKAADLPVIHHAHSGSRQIDAFRPTANNVHFVVSDEPGARKQRARNRQLVAEKAIEHINQRLDNTDAPPVFAIDIESEAFKLMTESSAWLTKDEAFRLLVTAAPASRKTYLADVRAALLAHKAANPRCSWCFLYSSREGISGLVSLTT